MFLWQLNWNSLLRLWWNHFGSIFNSLLQNPETFDWEWCCAGMNFLEHPSEFWEERSNVQSHPLSLHFTQRAETLDENRLYRKHTGNTTGNGSFRGLSRKLQRQNSVNCPPVGVISYSEPSSSSVIDSEKSLRSNDRDWIESGGSGVEEVLEENDLSWVLKLKLYGIVCVSTLLILSAASFLFISILLVDPILVGLKASFQNEPGICRWVYNVFLSWW